jgi:hypothetical protein
MYMMSDVFEPMVMYLRAKCQNPNLCILSRISINARMVEFR